MTGRKSLAKLKPLFLGRASRVLAGVAILATVPLVDFGGAGAIGGVALALLGLSFLVGGLVANPGCEITALLNLLLPRQKRGYFV